MNTSYKAKKSPRNQPVKFDETLAAALPAAAPVSRPRLSLRQIRIGLGIIWVAASLTAGLGVGRLIKAATAPLASSEAPAPVATANLAVTAAAATQATSTAIGQPAAPAAPNLVVAPAAG